MRDAEYFAQMRDAEYFAQMRNAAFQAPQMRDAETPITPSFHDIVQPFVIYSYEELMGC